MLTGPGLLIRMAPDGTRTTVLGGARQFQLTRPTSVAVGPDGALYVSDRGNEAGTGVVLRIGPRSPRTLRPGTRAKSFALRVARGASATTAAVAINRSIAAIRCL